MPLFNVELNRLADNIGASTLTIRLHTAAPSDSNPTNGRVTSGGGVYVSGFSLTAGNITVASNGDIENNVAIVYGAAVGAPGTVAWWSAYRGSVPVGWGTLPSTVIANGDSFSINANSLQINGSTS